MCSMSKKELFNCAPPGSINVYQLFSTITIKVCEATHLSGINSSRTMEINFAMHWRERLKALALIPHLNVSDTINETSSSSLNKERKINFQKSCK